MDPAHVTQCQQVVNVALAGSPDGRGTITYGTPTVYLARVVPRVKRMRGADGEDKTTSHVIVTELEIPANARIWIPPDSNTTPDSVAPDPTKARTQISNVNGRAEDGTSNHWQTWI